jgi:uncharacterized protein (DUF1499 family)
MARLRAAVEALPGSEIEEATPRYLRATVRVTPEGSVRDELELYLTPGDALVQFRSQRSPGVADFGANRRRVEDLRVSLKLSKLPVLRDRRMALWFESPLDTFGQADYDAAPPLR